MSASRLSILTNAAPPFGKIIPGCITRVPMPNIPSLYLLYPPKHDWSANIRFNSLYSASTINLVQLEKKNKI